MAGKAKHGLSYTPEYRVWQMMRLRCTEPTNQAYPDYGGRGIKVCDRWLNSVENFVADMGLKPTPKHEIDREDNDGDYTPKNCRWVTRTVNSRNRRSNHRLDHQGQRLTVTEWSALKGIPIDTLCYRLKSGWSVEQALETPVRPKAGNGEGRQNPKNRAALAVNLCTDCKVKRTSGLRCITCSNKSRTGTKRVITSTKEYST